jgi:hypothetical protein
LGDNDLGTLSTLLGHLRVRVCEVSAVGDTVDFSVILSVEYQLGAWYTYVLSIREAVVVTLRDTSRHISGLINDF